MVVKLLEAELPIDWGVHTQKLNLLESGLPAMRLRFFIIGTCRRRGASAVQRRLLAAPLRVVPPILPGELLTPMASPDGVC